MKKLWIVLLSVALIMAFAMPVCAADVKFSGSYIAQGYYENNRGIGQQADGTNLGPSVSNIWQRLRVQTDFQVQEGLSLTTRFDALEKIWGAARSTSALTTVGTTNSLGNNMEAENIKFEHAYVTFMVPWGRWQVGYMAQTGFGLDFGNSTDQTYGPRISYAYFTGPWTFGVIYDKYEGSKGYTSTGPSPITSATVLPTGAFTFTPNVAGQQADQDKEKISPYFIYKWAAGEAGLLLQYRWDSTTSGATSYTNNATVDNGYKGTWFVANPYFKARFGPVYTEGEFAYITGKDRKYESPAAGVTDMDRQGWQLYLMASVDLAPAYVGAAVVWVTGTDMTKTDKNTAAEGAGTDFNPCLILFNYDLARWNGQLGSITGYNIGTSSISYTLTGQPGTFAFTPGARTGQIFAGVKPIPKLDVRGSFTLAKADQTPSGVDSDAGKELDLTATYKIYDNLSYMVGFGYLWVGDMWKLGGAIPKIDNDYLVTHKLTLTF